MLRREKSFVSFETLKYIYQALVKPSFDYCSMVWGNCGEGLKEKLQRLQNRVHIFTDLCVFITICVLVFQFAFVYFILCSCISFNCVCVFQFVRVFAPLGHRIIVMSTLTPSSSAVTKLHLQP